MPATNFTSGVLSRSIAGAKRFVARQQLPIAAIGACAALVWIDQHAYLAAAIAILVLGATALLGWRRFLVMVALCGTAAGLHYRHLREEQAIHHEVAEHRALELEGKILKAPSATRYGWQAELTIEHCELVSLRGKKLMFHGRGNAPEVGQFIQSFGKLESIPGPRNVGEFNRAEWMRRTGFIGDFFATTNNISPQRPDFFRRRIEATRLAFRHAISQGLEPNSDEAKVIIAMVLGEQPPFTDPILQPFRHSGTLHLFSVSGQHVNLVAVILWLLLQWFRVPRKLSILLLIPAIFSYAWVTGASAPAVRAAWMAAVFLGAFLCQRKPQMMNSLAIVIIVTLFINGHLLFLAGVQLSYGVVAAIAIGASFTARLLHQFTLHDSYLPRDLYRSWQINTNHWAKKFLQSISISLAACIGSAPLTITYFGMITPISIIANLALTPIVAALLGLALSSALLSTISPQAAIICNQANGYVARACINVSKTFADIPGGHSYVSWNRPDQDSLRVFDLPQGGGAVLLQTDQSDQLLDCADSRLFSRIVLPSLRYLGAQPDTLLLSHPESGHIGGAVPCLSELPLQQIIAPVARTRSASFRELTQLAAQRQIPLYLAVVEKTIPVKESVYWQILYQPDPDDHLNTTDHRVAIYLLHFHGFRLLFLNDAGPVAIEEMAQRWPQLHCDVIVCGRHRMYAPLAIDWAKDWQARAVIATHADFPVEESLPARWVGMMRQSNIELFHQGETGMVSLLLEPNGELRLHGFLNQQQLTLKPLQPALAIPE